VQQGAFDRIPDYLAQRGIEWISGALFDLGISSPQVDLAERGFSYRSAGPLDMRMDTTQRLSAEDIVNGYDVERLADTIRRNSDERFARRIAQAIVAARPIRDTEHLARVVAEAIPAPARRTGGNPAKRTFQAIRIEVNNELSMLPGALEDAINATAVGGRVAVLSYHSGEDRIVKSVFAAAESRRQSDQASPYLHPSSERTFARRVRAAKRPSNDEVSRNPRAASALVMPVQAPTRQATRPSVASPTASHERHLSIVPGIASRSVSRFAFALVGMFVLISVIIGFQAFIAQQQLTLDHVSSELRLAKRYHDELRQVRAELLAPDYLREQAMLQGMTQGLGSRFVEVPEDVVAQVVISTGKMDPAIADPSPQLSPLAPLAPTLGGNG
jgi:16S rRNA (cytosine1402-N4)-methyltransferase